MDMKLTTAELVYINEAAKALKQKDFILISNVIIGIDNLTSAFTYITLVSTLLTNNITGAIFNTRSLSAFIKTITLESDFEFHFGNTLKTQADGQLQITTDQRILEEACRLYKYTISIDQMFPQEEVADLELTNKLYSMNKSDGGFMSHIGNHIATVFPSILPVSKNDILYFTVFNNYPMDGLFTVKYRICKKKFNVMVYISYIDV